MSEEFDITIGPNGDEVTIDKVGFSGKKCVGKADDIIKVLGKEVANIKKNEYYRNDEVHVQEFQ